MTKQQAVDRARSLLGSNPNGMVLFRCKNGQFSTCKEQDVPAGQPSWTPREFYLKFRVVREAFL